MSVLCMRCSNKGCARVMASYAESSAVFKARCLAVGLEEADHEKLVQAGLKTLAQFAFCSAYVPGGTESDFVSVMTKALGAEPGLGQMACLRRLHSEGYGIVATELKQQLESGEDLSSRKLAVAERAERLESQRKRLAGVSIRGPTEPSDSLVDFFVGVYDADRLRYLEWNKCTSRESELLHGKKETALKIENGMLKIQKNETTEEADTSTELLIRYCLTRRALAMEQANLLNFSFHEQWSEALMAARLHTPPAGYLRVSISQLRDADRKLFACLSEKCNGGLKAKVSGRPLDLVFEEVMRSSEVQHMLQPMQGKSEGPRSSGSRDAAGGSPSKKQKFPSAPAKGKGGKSKGKGTVLPSQLLELGCVSCTTRGTRLCFGYNLGRCDNPVSRQQCERGLHACAVRDCFKQHPAVECPKAKKQN